MASIIVLILLALCVLLAVRAIRKNHLLDDCGGDCSRCANGGQCAKRSNGQPGAKP